MVGGGGGGGWGGVLFFFFNDTATTEIYTLSLHDALPISMAGCDIKEQPVSRADNKEIGDEFALRRQKGSVNDTARRAVDVICDKPLQERYTVAATDCDHAALRHRSHPHFA